MFHVIWIISAAVMIALIMVFGSKINGSRWGVLLDGRKRVSLSQMQVMVWTVILISAVVAVSIYHQTANINMAPELWAVMGISVGSAFTSITVKSMKPAKTPKSTAAVKLDADQKLMGIQVVNTDVKDAKAMDMFKGEEQVDFDSVDIGKIQMFFVSLALWIGFVVTLWQRLPEQVPSAANDHVVNFPEFTTTMVTLLAISHAGYLSVKAIDKTPTKT